ncbi:MAG: T9SS type A sorting domain-containing protein [Proteobacteria bacterium]|nr:T9SS type A sorting domain-containing protein [Pseudomonadota bacterium]
MVYIAADNSLSSYADSDISEMEQASDNSNVNIIVLVDQKVNGGGDSKIIKIHNGGYDVITPTSESWWPSDNELNTADWNIAKDFFLWAMQNYPADHYAITFWDHGGGIFKADDSKKPGPNSRAICWDDTNGGSDYINSGEVREIVQALYAQNGNQKIDLIGYDVCIVGAIETHYQTADMVHVSVGSGATEPGDGWDWTFLKELANNANMDARTLGNYIVQYFGNYYSSTNATLGALDDDTLNAVFIPAFNTFVSELYNNMYDYKTQIQADRNNCSESLNNDASYGGPTPDFRDFANRIANDASLPTSLRNAATDVVNAFDRTVINSYSYGYTFNGASIWFPKTAPSCGSSWAGDNWSAYGSMIEFHNTQWDEFLLQYANPQQVLPVNISYDSHIIDDAGGNGKLDPGETADIIVTLHNGGTDNATNVAAVLSTTSPYITITDSNGTYGTIASNDTGNNNSDRYTVQVASNAPDGKADFSLAVTADGGYSTDISFNSTVGNPKNIFVWDGGSNNLSGTFIKNYLDSLGLIVTYSTGNLPTDYSGYDAIFLCFGIYSDNHNVSTTEATNITNYLDGGGNAYLEGGDILGYDNGKDVLMPYCGVASADDGTGSNDMGLPLTGQAGTVADGMTFSAYTGGNNYIDRYTVGSGSAVFTNGGNTFAVQYAHDTIYKTVTFAFELGGLTDNKLSSTKTVLLQNIIDFFGLDETGGIVNKANTTRQSSLRLINKRKSFNLEFSLQSDANVNISLIDVSGRVLRTIKTRCNAGSNSVRIGTANLRRGIYFVNVKYDGFSSVKKAEVIR